VVEDAGAGEAQGAEQPGGKITLKCSSLPLLQRDCVTAPRDVCVCDDEWHEVHRI
jgi:hypothetical protein